MPTHEITPAMRMQVREAMLTMCHAERKHELANLMEGALYAESFEDSEDSYTPEAVEASRKFIHVAADLMEQQIPVDKLAEGLAAGIARVQYLRFAGKWWKFTG